MPLMNVIQPFGLKLSSDSVFTYSEPSGSMHMAVILLWSRLSEIKSNIFKIANIK